MGPDKDFAFMVQGWSEWYPEQDWGEEDWEEPWYEPMENNCTMIERVRADGSCEKCKKPYVQSEDGRSCEFVGKRTYKNAETDRGKVVKGKSAKYMGRLVDYKQYGKGFYKWPKGNTYYGMWYDGKKHGM